VRIVLGPASTAQWTWAGLSLLLGLLILVGFAVLLVMPITDMWMGLPVFIVLGIAISIWGFAKMQRECQEVRFLDASRDGLRAASFPAPELMAMIPIARIKDLRIRDARCFSGGRSRQLVLHRRWHRPVVLLTDAEVSDLDTVSEALREGLGLKGPDWQST
jgi:hypothetical protein